MLAGTGAGLREDYSLRAGGDGPPAAREHHEGGSAARHCSRPSAIVYKGVTCATDMEHALTHECL